MTTREQLEKAKKHIQIKEYDEARRILVTIDHPTAEKWLARLDVLQDTKPQKVIPAPLPYKPVEPVTHSEKKHNIAALVLKIFILGFFGLVLLGVIAVVVTWRNIESTASNLNLQSRLFGYCMDVYIEVGSLEDEDIETCKQWYPRAYDLYEDKVIACDKLSPELDKPFMDCLLGEDILPDGIYRTR